MRKAPSTRRPFLIVIHKLTCYNHDSDWRQSVLLHMGEVICVTLYEKLSLLIAALTLAVEITILLLSF